MIDFSRRVNLSKSLTPKLALAASSVIAALVLAEMLLRFIFPLSGYYPILSLRPNRRMKISVNAKGVSPEATYTTNSIGVRGDEPPADWDRYFTVITVGGSTTECMVLDDSKTWPYLLQQDLKKKYPGVWVGNAGVSGDTTRGHLLFVQQFVPHHTPRVLLFLIGINDLGHALAGDFDSIVLNRSNTLVEIKNSLLASSRVLQLAYRLYKSRFSTPTMHQDLPFEINPATNPLQLPNDPKAILSELGLYRENISKIINVARAMGVQAIFMTQPTVFQTTPRWTKIDSNFRWYKRPKEQISGSDMRKLMDIYNQELLDVCEEKRANCLDLAAEISGHDENFYDSFHFTELGARRIAEIAARYMLRIAPKPSTPQNAS